MSTQKPPRRKMKYNLVANACLSYNSKLLMITLIYWMTIDKLVNSIRTHTASYVITQLFTLCINSPKQCVLYCKNFPPAQTPS
uniref:Uncharacterized protein n=1 Tax=Rhizophora mucronata TaxID=61149 RepID=A0A2P2QNV4_RHIMU